MSFGALDVVAESVRLGMRNIFKVIGYYIIFGIAAVLVNYLSVIAAGPSLDPLSPLTAAGPLGVISMILTQVIMLAAAMAIYVAMLEDAAGSPTTFFDGLTRGVQRTPIALLVSIILVPLYMIVLGVIMLAASVAGNAAPVVMIISAPFLIWLAMCLVPLFPIVAGEDAGIGAIRRTFSLTHGRRFGIFLGGMVLFFITFCITMLVYGVFMLLGGMAVISSPDGLIVSLAIIAILYLVMMVCFGAVFSGYQVATYTRLRELEDA